MSAGVPIRAKEFKQGASPLLSERYPLHRLPSLLLAREVWRPYPTIENCAAWQTLSKEVRAATLTRGEAALRFEWPALPATLFLQYARVGNRTNFETVQWERRRTLCDLVLAECVEGQGRFLDDIVNGIWATCEETYWGYPAHVDAQKAGVGLPDVEEPTVDLFAAEAVALLAWSVYLLGDRLDTVSPLVRRRVMYEAQRRVLDPCLHREDFWWMGFHPGDHGINNWNPWINSNWLAAVLLLETDAARRTAAVHKILCSLDVFIGVYAESGGCDEGPGYWGRAAASLFDCLDLLRSASDGGIDVFDVPKIQNMGRYIARVHIHDHYYVNFADASAINHPPAPLVYRYGQAIDDQDMLAFGAWLMAEQAGTSGRRGNSLGRVLPALFEIPDPLAAAPAQPPPRDVWFDGIQVLIARDQPRTAEGFFLAAKAGHNGESHNHNDVGSFIVCRDGKPILVDAGVETYRRKTFSPQRYEIWTMQSAYHTLLPTFETKEGGNVMQAPGKAFAARGVAYCAGDAAVQLSLDLSGTYPPTANLQAWGRTVALMRGAELLVEDTYVLVRPVKAISLALLTPCEVAVDDDGVHFGAATFGPVGISREAGTGRLVYAADAFKVVVERVAISDARLGGVWGDHLNRVIFRATAPPVRGSWVWRLTPP